MAEDKSEVSVVENKALLALCSQEGVRRRFEQLLGGRNGAAFISSIISCANENDALAKCRPESIVAAGVMAATVNLPVTPGLGWAAIVPYKGEAQFQIMKDGYVQLALRTGQYRAINCSDVYEDEFESWNPHTGELKTHPQSTWRQREEGSTGKIVGYLAFFELLNGFKKYSYWTIAQLEAHGKKYSQSYRYNKGLWVDNKPAMYLKTPLKLLISHFGPMSTQMQYAMEFDQATRKQDGTVEYPDGRVVETTTIKPEDTIQPPRKLEKPTVKAKPEPKKEPTRAKPEAKKHEGKGYPPDDWEGPFAVNTAHECVNCADNIVAGQMAYRSPDVDEPEFSHADHFQSPE
jgi:recombination protein RecT